MSKKTSKQYALWAAAAVLLIGLTVAGFVLPVKEWAEAFQGWIEGFGAWGMAIFALAYVLAVVLLVPASPLTIAGGLAFGFWAIPLIVVSATIGATLAFLVARYLARKKVQKLIAHRPNFTAVDKAVSKEGWKIVALLRLSPAVPFSLQNYVMGVSQVGLVPYIVATFLGIVPGTALYVYLGTVGQQAGKGASAAQWAFYTIGFVVTVVITVFITIKAKAELKKSGLGKAPTAAGKKSK